MGIDATPGRACLFCKRMRIKCDQRHPACFNCIRAGLRCPGVKQLASDARNHETPPPDPHRQRPARDPSDDAAVDERRASEDPPKVPSDDERSLSPTDSVSNDLVLHGSAAERLKVASTAALLGAFSASFMTKSDIGRRGMHLDHLASMFGAVSLDSPLRSCTEAVGMNMFRHVFRVKDHSFVQNSLETQAGAIIALGKGLKDPRFSTSDEALMCTVILSLMEYTCSSDPKFNATLMHVNGAINILRHRGASETPSKAYIKLFRMVRTTMVMKYMHESIPVPTFPSTAGWTFDRLMSRGFASDLQMLAFDVAAIRVDCKNLFDAASPGLPDDDEIDHLIWRANEVAEALNDWFSTLPPSWAFETVAIDSEEMDYRGHTIGWNGLTHQYRSLYTAVNVNLYRCLFIYTQAVIVRCGALHGDSELAESAVLRTVDDVCHSVSWFGTIPCVRAPGADRTMAGGRAGYYLLLPLFVCLTVELLPDDQRYWLRQVMFSRSQDPPLAIAAFLSQPDQTLIYDGVQEDGTKVERTQPIPYLPVGLTLEEGLASG